MADGKVVEIAKNISEQVRVIVDAQILLLAGSATLKTNSKAYYKASRQVFKAVVAAAAQRMMDEGANRQLLLDTKFADDAWQVFLDRNPKIKAKLALPEPKIPPKPSGLKLIPGGMASEPQELLIPPAPIPCEGCGTIEEEHKSACPNVINELNGDEVL